MFFLSVNSEISFFRSSNFSSVALSFSFFNASNSISSCNSLLVTSSSSVGIEFLSVFIFADASSIRSIALSGKNLSLMYLSLRVAAAIIALSVILIPWNISNFSFNPRRIETVSSTVGSSTIIG